MLNNRLRRRLFNHILMSVGSLALTVIFMHFFPKRDFISRLSIGTAYPALFLTAAALLLGPLNVLCQKPNPVSFDLDRKSTRLNSSHEWISYAVFCLKKKKKKVIKKILVYSNKT